MTLSHRLIGRALLAALAISLSMLVSQADARPDMELALQDDAVLVERYYYDRDTALTQAREMGVNRLRVNVTWHDVEPVRGHYDFARYDAAVAAAAAYGIRVQFTLAGKAPAWATGNRRVGNYRPSSRAFGAFARAVATHFRGRVDRYSIWNEPNWHSWLEPPSQAPRLYRNLHVAGYKAIKGADPRAQVLIGETAPIGSTAATPPLAFLRKVACVDRRWRRRKGCAPLKADGYAHHPYDFTNSPDRPDRRPGSVTIGTLGRLTKALDKLARARALRTPRGGRLDIYLTEFGYRQSGKRSIPQSRRAVYLRRAYTIARRNRRVRQMLQYLLVTPPPMWAFFDTAVLRPDGTATPAYHALRAFAR